MPQISKSYLQILILTLSLGLHAFGSDDLSDGGNKIEGGAKTKAFPSILNLSPLGFYKQYISPIDGDRCQMHPSCSEYAKQAVEEYGKLKGVLLTFDRLTRCGSDLHLYDTILVDGKTCFHDPPRKLGK